GIIVTSYQDYATATMREHEDGSGEFSQVTLNATITIVKGDDDAIIGAFQKAHDQCFIARSVNFPVVASRPNILR
ncbi:hypothetical protein ABTF83_19860, partial [Acinetobacter baumannii]